MDARHDALAAAAEAVLAVERHGRAEPGLVATVGRALAVAERRERRPGRGADAARHASRRRRRSPADGGRRACRRRGHCCGARYRRRLDDALRHAGRGSRRDAARATRRCRPRAGAAGARARERRGPRRRRPLAHLSGGDAVRPLRRRRSATTRASRSPRRTSPSRSTSSNAPCARPETDGLTPSAGSWRMPPSNRPNPKEGTHMRKGKQALWAAIGVVALAALVAAATAPARTSAPGSADQGSVDLRRAAQRRRLVAGPRPRTPLRPEEARQERRHDVQGERPGGAAGLAGHRQPRP